MKIRWQWLLYPVTVSLYLVFMILVYLPVIIYSTWRMRRIQRQFLQAVKDANEGKIPEWLVVPGRTGSAKAKSVKEAKDSSK